jgi:simple sugar transport system ATP-binding protein
MVGKEIKFEYDKKSIDPAEQKPVLEMKNVECFNAKHIKSLKSLSLELRSGEILGICGVDGNGQSELSDCITGLTEGYRGNVLINGVDVTNKKPLDVLKHKVSHIPEDRHKRGSYLA